MYNLIIDEEISKCSCREINSNENVIDRKLEGVEIEGLKWK